MSLIHQAHAACTTLGCNMAQSSSWISTSGIQWGNIISSIIGFLFFLAAVSTLIYLLWGGIDMITSGGDSGKFENGRNRLVFAAIGMIVVASSYAVWRLILTLVGIDSIDTGIF